MTQFALALLVVSTLQAGPARVVRHGDERLAGITAVDILIATSPDTARCGLDTSALQAQAVAAVTATGVKATVSQKASSWFYTIKVEMTSLLEAGRCATSVQAELVAQVEGIPEADRFASSGSWGSLLVGELSLVRQTAVVSTPPADHAARVLAALGEQLKAIGSRIKAANNPVRLP